MNSTESGMQGLSPEDKNYLEKHIWYFKFPGIGSRAHLDPGAELDQLLLKEIKFEGKSVLNIGCREGFFAFYAEHSGASRVLAIDDQPKEISSEKPFNILKSVLGKKCEHRILSSDEIYKIDEKFDIVLLSDCLAYTENPEKLLQFARGICKEQLWLLSHFVLDNTDTPLNVYLRNYTPEPYYPARRAFNIAWLLNHLDQSSFSANQAKLHSNMKFISLLCKPKDGFRSTNPVSYAEMPLDDKQVAQTAILVMSCKKFEQLWDPFFILFKRYWPDCPYKIYFCSDVGTYPGVENIEIGKDLGWASNCKFALDKISESRIILFQEDFLLSAPADTERVRKLAAHAHTYDVGCLRLSPVPGASAKWYAAEEVGVIQPYDDYRLSMQIAIWKKQLFNDLLIDGESPWQVEIEGSKRATVRPEIFLSTWENKPCPIPYFITAVEKGEWKDEAFALLDKEGIPRSHINKKVY